MRYKDIYVTAPRAFSKSFITILGLILQCIFMPGTKRFICAPGKGQSAQIAKEKITENTTVALLTISEGKYHQVKRMFQAVQNKVVYLKRISIGKLQLDTTLQPGEYKLLTEEDIEKLFV